MRLCGGLDGPVAEPVAWAQWPCTSAGALPGALPGVIAACSADAAAFSKSTADGRAGRRSLQPLGRTKNFWRWAFPKAGLGVAGLGHNWPNGAIMES